MTYQSTDHTAHPAHTAHVADLLRRAAAGLRRFFAGIGHGIMTSSTAHHRYEQFLRLQAKSDAELAQLGLKRDELVQHVFKDHYHF